MPPRIAALGCTLFVIYLLWVDLRKKDASWALWIPLTWMFLAGSRYLSLWINLGAPPSEAVSAVALEGSALDRSLFLVLIASALIVIQKRGVKWPQLFANNKWIWLYFAFGLLSLLWSDYPFVSFKRLIKAFGNVIMILVVFSEKRPYEAAAVLIRRFAFLVVPASVLFVKYYPEIGRTYNPWTWEPMYTGVSMQKNGLGQLCLISGIYFCWNLMHGGNPRLSFGWRPSLALSGLFLVQIAWLLRVSDSATSLVCLTVVTGLLVASRVPLVARAPGRFLGYGLTAALVFGLLEAVFDISGTLIAALGRDPSLTTRVPMWHTLLGMVSNPLLGSGYESFWLDARIPHLIWPAFGYLHNAHNGYLETYLNVGLVGLALIVGGLITGLVKIQRHLNEDLPSGLLRLSLFLTVIIYNWTEATFAAVNNVWVISFIAIVDLSGQWQEQEREAAAQPDRRPAPDRAPEKLVRWSPAPVPARVVTGIAAGRQFVPRVRAPQRAYGERKALP